MTTVFLIAREHDPRGELILSTLEHGEPARPHGDTAGVRLPAPPEAAREEVAKQLDAVDEDWPSFVAML
jgi:hypothetical protein